MCGINGGTFSNKTVVEKMNNAIGHRGPDARGLFTDEQISLGHLRLSVIDLSPAGSQPMWYRRDQGASSEQFHPERMATGDYGLVFNGEIYNYAYIRDQLSKEGYVFTTQTDSEVILASYAAWGESCVTRFNGMWAFCIYDRKRRVLFCSRDRMGVKPLYYYHEASTFLFSSEIKGLLAHENLRINEPTNIDTEAVELYFSFGYIPAPLTIYKNVRKLEAAHNLSFNLTTHEVSVARYWELPRYAPHGRKKDLIQEGAELLTDAVKLRLHADVPVGAFLSGGLDSSAIVAEMKKQIDAPMLHTFSIGFEGRYDETSYIDIVRAYLGTNHHHAYFKREDFEEHVDDFVTMYDEPMADYSGFPTRLVSEHARKHVTVSLSGDGGDEVFGGYPAHVMGYQLDLLVRLPRFVRAVVAKLSLPSRLKRTKLGTLVAACRASLSDPGNFLAGATLGKGIRTESARARMRKEYAYALERGGNSHAEAMRIYDALFNTLPNAFLVKVDRASMFHALEVRSPFLDYRFFEYAQRIPSKWKAGIKNTKILMRDIITDMLPAGIVYRNKQGFEPPIADWMLDGTYDATLSDGVRNLEKIVPEIASWYQERLTTRSADDKTYLVRLFLFQKWYEKWVAR